VPKHESNAERIARAAAEASATLAEKAAAPPKPKAPRKPRAPAAPKARVRIKIVWAVGKPGNQPAKTYPYAERAAADAESVRIGKGCMVTPLKVPME
jgi:hypothetical protein